MSKPGGGMRALDVFSVREVLTTDSPWATEVDLRVNGRSITEIAAAHGVTREWLGPPVAVVALPSDHLLGGPDRWEDPAEPWFADGLVAVAACPCGQPGCDALLTRVEVAPTTVRWSAFVWYRRPDIDLSALSFIFDREDYVRSLGFGSSRPV